MRDLTWEVEDRKRAPLFFILVLPQTQNNKGAQAMNQTLSYTQSPVYVGIDVHKKSYSVAVWFNGQLIKKASMPADLEKLAVSLRSWYPDHEIRSVYEAGFSGFGLHRYLLAQGIRNIVINASSIEVAANDKKKTDKRDAKKLAEQLAWGRLKCIYIPTPEEELRRQITRTREQIVEMRTSVSNQIKSKLHYFGYIKPDDDRRMSASFIEWIATLDLQSELRVVLNMLIQHWQLCTDQIKEFEVELLTQGFEDSECEAIYQSVPGVGAVSARTLANELGDLSKRFRNQDAIYQYTGLTPSESSSGESVRKGNIDRQGSPRVRKILVEVAWRAIEIDGALRESFDRIASRRGKTRAIVAIARKLIGRIRACFAKQTLYVTGLVA
jgi:transposase